jgi:hypothetical protein
LTLLGSLERSSLEVPSWHRVEVRVFASRILLYKEIGGSLDPKAPLAKIAKGEIRMLKGIAR